jgi:hypothetical protein
MPARRWLSDHLRLLVIAMFVYAGFTAVTEKLYEIIEQLPPPRQPMAHSRRN